MSCRDPPPPLLVPPTPLELRIKPDTLVKVGCCADNGEGQERPPRFVVGYWSIRGLGASIRMMLGISNVPHWIALYDILEDDDINASGGWNKTSWMDVDKQWMKKECSPFMNLPYLIDVEEQIVLCQTNAIQSYLGRELGMLGSTKLETAKCEELMCEIYDLRNCMVGFVYNPKMKSDACWKRAQQGYLNKLEAHLDHLSSSSSSCSPFYLVAKSRTAPDFHLFELLEQFEALLQYYKLGPTSMALVFPKLASFKAAMEEEYQGYLSSFVHRELPFNAPFAQFGSEPLTNGPYQRRGQDAPRSWTQKGIMVIDYSNDSSSSNKEK